MKCPAATGAEMWVLLDSAPADLVVLDIMLPGTNGIELFRKLRRLSDVPIIFIRARQRGRSRARAGTGRGRLSAKPFGTRTGGARRRRAAPGRAGC
jgi:DNA-binding response OmpR family regulator